PLKCESFDDSVCVLMERGSDIAFCFPSCSVGGGSQAKCGDRPDVACERLANDEGEEMDGFCRPFCSMDADCTEGNCNRKHSTCVPEGNDLDDFGTSCTLGEDERSCSGLCVQLNADD